LLVIPVHQFYAIVLYSYYLLEIVPLLYFTRLLRITMNNATCHHSNKEQSSPNLAIPCFFGRFRMVWKMGENAKKGLSFRARLKQQQADAKRTPGEQS